MSSTPTKVSTPGAGCAGADVGASLVKLALPGTGGATSLESHPASDLPGAARRLAECRPRRVGVTGGGAPRLVRLLDSLGSDTARVDEFAAWSAGARSLLRRTGGPPERFLLVSVGTGTSAMLVEGATVARVGGTALGGGTLLGLGNALLGRCSFEELAELARSGDRRQVDLLIADIYPEGDFLLPGDVNAASFAKLARSAQAAPAAPSDLAHGLMGLVGENVALICCSLAAASNVEQIVFGGTTLRENPSLVAILQGICCALGRRPVFLPEGGFVGALGALECCEAAAAAGRVDAVRR